MPDNPNTLAGFGVIPEPPLLFAGGHTDTHPLRGMIEHGPYSADLGFPSRVRLAFFAPSGLMSKLDALATELTSKASPGYAPRYYPQYPGFEELLRVPLIPPRDDLRCPATSECQSCATRQDGDGLVAQILHSVGGLLRMRQEFDVLMLYLPNSWSPSFEYEGFDLHDRLKAKLAPLGLTVQVINDTAFERDRANVMWGLAGAIYAKAGGIPWKLADSMRDEAYIGIGYAIKEGIDGIEYSTCCSQVFDPDGTGFEFVAYDTREFTTDSKKNPFLSYQEMHSVLSKSLSLYQDGHSGRIPRKIFIHKSTHFTPDETQGALDAFRGTEVELIQVIRGSDWFGLKLDRHRGRRGRTLATPYPVDRGVYLPISGNECLLWTQGSVTGVDLKDPKAPVYKDGALKPIPTPILVRRFTGAGGWHDTCSSILGLTKVDWNNNTLHKVLPVTLVYSQVFASVVKRTPDIVDRAYDYRFFM